VILVDTSVWVDHLRKSDAPLQKLLDRGEVLSHPLVIGELAMGNLRQRDVVLGALHKLPKAIVAQDQEVLRFISDKGLFDLGIGYIDAHLLAAVQLTAGALLWTRDKRLLEIARRLSLASGLRS
jgi:predicted nucleic acid-binding protein